MNHENVAKILRALAGAIESADEKRLEAVLTALRSREIGSASAKKGVVKNRHSKVDVVELQNVLTRLNEATTREQGYSILDALDLSRKELERLSRLRNIHVTKIDDVPKIKEKLVELIIGGKLNSKAIRGD